MSHPVRNLGVPGPKEEPVDFWYPDDDAPIDPAWWAPLMRFGLAMARDGLPALDPEEFRLRP